MDGDGMDGSAAEPAFFGYGSLVNRATHDYPGARPARLAGWRRVWVHTALRPVAFLSAEPAAGVEIDGLAALVPGGDWAALDAREYAYRRHPVVTGDGRAVQVYAVPEDGAARPSARHPVLLSYLDTVAQGFLREFGRDGLARFFATTAGWDVPVLDDRASPRYPRAQGLTGAERALVDARLAALSVRVTGRW
ncbi:MAG: gamma-glutamylcyclotransferase family protein [Gemmobacter sp.]